MKNLILIAILLIISLASFAGGGGGPTTPPSACNTASPFCTGTNYNFPNSTNVASLGANGIYDCLGSTPNPVWYHMQVSTPGNLIININQTSNAGNPIDVDFVMWGPFSSLAAGCAGISANNVVDCSYSTSASEQANVPNAQTGEFYILLMTNYSGTAGNISFSSAGTASTNCNILCNMTALSATPGLCDPSTGQYSVSGQITFQYPPTSGTLTVSSSCGATVDIPGPWISPMSYTLSGLTANGGACNATASFSADATCTFTQNYTAPSSCNCSVTAGNTGPVCPGNTVDLTATTVVGATNYSWTGPNGFSSNQQNPTAVPVPSLPGSYTYNLTVIYSGQPCTSSTTVVVNDPLVDAGIDQTVCAGEPVTLSGALATTYTWDNGVTDGIAFVPAATGIYTVIGTTNGCTASDQVLVTVNPLPIVNAGNDVAVCAGESVILTGSGGNTWDNGITNGVSFIPLVTTTYTLSGTVNGCTSADMVIVTVNPLPIANAGADQAVCNGVSVTLAGSGGTPTWSGGITDGLPFTPNVTTVYTLTIVDANQCVATDDVTITVNNTSVIDAGANQTVCSGTPVSLSGSGGTSYTWNNGVQDGISFVPAVGTVTYTAVDNNPTGCSGTDQVTITVNPLPIVDAGNDTLICFGVSIALVGQGAVTYVWDNNAVNGIAFVPPSSTTYSVVGTDANGCQGTDQVTISVTPTPIVSFTPSVSSGCIPLSVTFTNTNPTNNTYQWNFGNGISSTNVNSVSTTYFAEGCYDVTLISTTPNGCVGQTTIPSIVCANSNPEAAFTTNPNVLSLIDTESQLLNESIGASTYIWNFGDGFANSTEVNPTHIFPSDQPGSYQITLIAISTFGCTDTTQVNIEVQDAVIYYVPNTFTPDEDEHNPIFKPIFTSGFDPMDYKMQIFDRWGEVVFETHDVEYGWDGTYNGTHGLVKEGAYVWKIEFKTTLSDERRKIIGNVTLLR
jgi:gliding motility-associated-like protein